jgi:glycine cleavage system pyridoxal-binding protein P
MASVGQMTGMRGVYLVAAELSKHGLIASPTSQSAMEADILVTDQKCIRVGSMFGIGIHYGHPSSSRFSVATLQ